MDEDRNVEQTLRDLEEEGWAALSSGRGVEFYNEHFVADGVMVFPTGAYTRAQALEGIAAAPPWSEYELRNLQVLHLSTDAACVVYEAIAQRAGQPVYHAWMTSTYVQSAAKWKLALHTQTPIA
jgi:hypothetical protein